MSDLQPKRALAEALAARARFGLMVAALLVVRCAIGQSDAAPASADLASQGRAALQRRGCDGCHTGTAGALAGADQPLDGTMAYASNLTPDRDAGLGAWRDDEIVRAVRGGVARDGRPLCDAMPRYPDLSDAEARALVAYLRSVAAVAHAAPPSLCADDTTPDAAPDATDDATLDVEAPPDVQAARDASPPLDVSAPRDVPAPPDVPTTHCAPVINEVQTGSIASASDEFIELFSPCATTLSLAGWRLTYRAAANATPLTATETALAMLDGLTLAPGGYLVLGGAAFHGRADGATSGGLAAAGGGVGLRDAAGALVDSVGYGTATNVFVRGAPAPQAPTTSPAGSIGRIPNGVDTGVNARDFRVQVVATPRAPNH